LSWDELSFLKLNHSIVTPVNEDSNVNELQYFINAIQYSNIVMNIDGEESDEEVNSSTFISDFSIIVDRQAVPPVLCIAQYFGAEGTLCGGPRQFKPWIIYMFDFAIKSWYIFDRTRTPAGYTQSPYVCSQCLNEELEAARYDGDRQEFMFRTVMYWYSRSTNIESVYARKPSYTFGISPYTVIYDRARST
jgi:hypothetical protein